MRKMREGCLGVFGGRKYVFWGYVFFYMFECVFGDRKCVFGCVCVLSVLFMLFFQVFLTIVDF